MPRECLAIIESKSKVRYSCNKPVVAKKSQNQAPATMKVVEESCVTCGGAYSYRNCPVTGGNVYRNNIQEFVSQAFAVNYNQGNTSYRPPMMSNQIRPHGFPPRSKQSECSTLSKEQSKPFQSKSKSGKQSQTWTYLSTPGFLTSSVPSSSLSSSGSSNISTSTLSSGTLPSNTIANSRCDLKTITTRSVVPTEYPVLDSEPVNSLITEHVASPLCRCSFLMPKFGPSIKSFLTNKDKLCELAITPLNEHCSAILLRKLPEKLGDPSKFLIPCDFPRKAEYLALADLGASINLMPLSVWNKLSLPDLSPTCMTLELSDRLISRSVGVLEDVYVKLGTFHFPADFVVVDFDADPRVPLLLERSFLKTERALIDVFEGELYLCVGKEAITINLDQTSRYSANYNDMTTNRIDVIDMACEEYSQEVLGFSNVITSVNPTPYYDPIVSTTSSTLTPFRKSDFLLEEVDAFLALEYDPTSTKVDQFYLNSEGDILLLEAFLNDDPSLPPPNQGNYLPEVHKELKIYEAKSDKSLIDEPPELEEKTALKMVLKSHKQSITWKLSDIKGIEFCTHKILMEEEFEPAVQHQRIVNPKIHDVIKQEVLKLLDAGLIYPISDSPWEFTNSHRFERSGENHIHLPIQNVCLPSHTFWAMQCTSTFQRCMMAIFHDMIEKTMEVFMDDFLIFRNSFQSCLSHLEKMLKRCEDTKLCLYWEKSHFMVKAGIILGHKISKEGIEVDKAEVDVITKLCHPTTVKGIRSFLGHAGFYRRKLTKAPILIAPDWDMPFELMCDASDFAVGAVLGQRQEKHFRPIHYASKTITEAESNYTTTEKEMLAVVYAFEKFCSNLIMNKSIVYKDHSALKYFFAKKDSKARLLRSISLL
uniref:RNA-directed DNA polymerase n=1 Tax=Tanacetum cinerariifolium TaxID=118510 RepID=A0A699HHH2_TANCI|nr:reverse transcriptase domain-containing protein [Tanacetum cinerariifolium]